MPDSNVPKVLIQPLKPAVIEGMAQKLPVLVRVQAPDAGANGPVRQRPYHLSLVLDRSGSMSGSPLREAVRCARHIVDRLKPSDLASIVAFDGEVDVLAPTQTVGDGHALHAALSRIHERGSTNLYGGWRAGVDSLLPHVEGSALARVILLSDGNANVGEIVDAVAISEQCTVAMKQSVSTSTYGLGRSFNEVLMVNMARQGGGNHYYGETAADLLEPFAEEFDLIASLYARQVRLRLTAPDGVSLVPLNDYPTETHDGMHIISLPDVTFGAEAWALVELRLPAALAVKTGFPVLQAAAAGTTPDGLAVDFAGAVLVLDAVSAQAWDAVLPDPLVAARQAELEAASLLNEARVAADDGDWAAIERLISVAQARFQDQPWVMEVLQSLADLVNAKDRDLFSKAALYSIRKFDARLSAKDEALFDRGQEISAPSFLRRKRAQGKAEFEHRPNQNPDDDQGSEPGPS